MSDPSEMEPAEGSRETVDKQLAEQEKDDAAVSEEEPDEDSPAGEGG